MTDADPRGDARVSSGSVAPSRSSRLSLPPVPLADVADAVTDVAVRGDTSTPVSEAAYDSRDAGAGSLFFCVPGSSWDGHAFAEAAAREGAAALVVERWLDEIPLPQVRVRSVRGAMGPMSAVVFGSPAEAITMLGITGTNGKTTTTYLLESILVASGVRTGVIGTNGARVAGKPLPLERTTPEAPDLHRLLAHMRAGGVDAVAMEVSSHALEQHRVGGVRYRVAGFTNLSRDHLDYHPSMESYFHAKARLFTPAHARCAVVNGDDAWGRRLLDDASVPITTYGVESDVDVRARDVRVDATGLRFTVDDTVVRSSLLGGFNVWNCLGAFAVARACGIDDGTAAQGIGALRGIPGRVEPVEGGQNFLVMVDYAHTPDSILRVLQASRPLTSGRLIVVFGCGGDRDRAKRPLMGAAASANADLTVLTSDNPRSEDPGSIIGDIETGVRGGGGSYMIEPDRRAAIALAIGEARAGDVVVVAGKGHESHQELADGTVDFDDRLVALEELRASGAGE
jgi:UDP-N-acetylmuramoyl-L-alanyl-D-glutamate--2,6-diaminopimelate ligase